VRSVMEGPLGAAGLAFYWMARSSDGMLGPRVATYQIISDRR
jgi:hypothetical protein